MLHGVSHFFGGKLRSVRAGELMLDFCRAHVHFLVVFGCGESSGLVVGFEVIYGVLGDIGREFILTGEVVVDALLALVCYFQVMFGFSLSSRVVVGFEVIYGVLGSLGREFILAGELIVDAPLAHVHSFLVVFGFGKGIGVVVGFEMVYGVLGGLGREFIHAGEPIVDALLAHVQELREVLRLSQSRLVIVRVRVSRFFRGFYSFLHLVQLL